jgi:hypothetical protein
VEPSSDQLDVAVVGIQRERLRHAETGVHDECAAFDVRALDGQRHQIGLGVRLSARREVDDRHQRDCTSRTAR